jgi:uncharacterized cupredoxin-like copper-binding protein
MTPRVLAAVLPTALLLLACSGSGPASTPTHAPSPWAAAAPSPTQTTAVIGSASASPSVAPSATPLTGEVEVILSDAMRFSPDPITVKVGEEVTFVVKNEGLMVHEFVVGTEEEQSDHAAEMAEGGMSHGHDNALSLTAGETGSLTMTFAEATSLLIGCHEPGHYEAGMKATLEVVD